MESILWIPPKGIQNAYIGTTNIGDAKFLYDLQVKNKRIELSGAGTHIDKDIALKLSKYEALERIANAINCRPSIIETKKNLKVEAVDMEKFPKLTVDEESFNINFSPNQTYSWVECVDLYTLKVKYIPANYIYLYQEKNFYGDRITNPITTGSALHKDYVSAIINGIYEVLERDSISLTWLLKDIKGDITHLFKEESLVFNSAYLGEVKFYDVSTVDGVITICAHAKANFSNNCKNALMFCSGLNLFDIKEKISKELMSIMFSFYHNSESYRPSTDFTSFFRVDEGGTFMSRSFNDNHFDFFENVPPMENIYNKRTKDLSKIEELRYLIKILKKESFSVYVADISSREVLENNYKAVKVIIPEAQPISFIYSSKYLASNRFIKFAKKKYGEDYEKYINKMPLAFS